MEKTADKRRAGKKKTKNSGTKFGRHARITALILGAGYATRLYPLTRHIPKPLLYVTPSKRVIDFIVTYLEELGLFDEIIVVTNSKFYPHFLSWARSRRRKLNILDDGTRTNDDRRGAIGDIHFAIKRKAIATDLLVIGGDNLFDKGFGRFIDFAFQHSPFASLGLYDIRDIKEASRFGIVKKDSRSKLISFQEKPLRPSSTLAATCLYYFPQESLPLFKEYVGNRDASNDATGNYIRWLSKKSGVYGFTLKKGQWFDIGHLDLYREVLEIYAGKK